ncbi:MAG TPA: transferrin receptor-like dimerization domain-containing protein [Gemmatimonadales bacterium]|nr:transferrin receptor-like dimerization domain-containing protein [Gemmatimonadales bacterium]
MRVRYRAIVNHGTLPGALVLGLCVTPLAQTPAPAAFRGYSSGTARAEAEWETRFRDRIVPDTMRETMRHLSARPHHLGSPYDRANAEWILARFRAWGWDAALEHFDVLFPTPRDRLVELVAPRKFTARLVEPPVPGDPTSAQQSEQLPPYNAYSIDGDVTAPLVYVNYGIPADYERLEQMGVSVRGAIVIARYGASWRGIKPKVAAEHGAVGCLIYSDPRDDGYQAGDVFPTGPWRPAYGVQRGSVMDMPIYPGDPLTPGEPSVPGTKRLALGDAQTLTRIPVLPLSYGDAQPLLAALAGPVAPAAWRGGLAITYHVGPGPARVHLRARFDWSTRTISDVVARLPGATEPDQWIVRGNHYDAWVNGAWDPLSGQSALLEEARILGALAQAGWKPRRTIIYAAWDGEEPGLIGSTEWVEAHAAELERHAAAYVNTDLNGRGFISIGGSHSLERFMNEVAKDIRDPETGLSVWSRERLHRIAEADSAAERREVRGRADLRLDALGSGSDYTPFLQHAGIASLNLAYGGEDGGGIYHSVYDDFFWYMRFDDSAFVYERALAQTAGTAVMRLADAPVLPFEFGNLAETVARYVDELRNLGKREAENARERNRELDEGMYAAITDPRAALVAPERQEIPREPNLARLDSARMALARSAERYERALDALAANGGAGLDSTGARATNPLLIRFERSLTDTAGLPGRPWFRHLLYAPGRYTGYGVKTVPGVREALERRNGDEAQHEIMRVAAALLRSATVIDSAAAVLERVATP